MEVLTIKEGLVLAQNLGIRAPILERDATFVIESFEQSSLNLSHNGVILIEAFGIASSFSFFRAQYVPRCCNLVADKIANLARIRDNQIWTNEPPTCIMDVQAHKVGL